MRRLVIMGILTWRGPTCFAEVNVCLVVVDADHHPRSRDWSNRHRHFHPFDNRVHNRRVGRTVDAIDCNTATTPIKKTAREKGKMQRIKWYINSIRSDLPLGHIKERDSSRPQHPAQNFQEHESHRRWGGRTRRAYPPTSTTILSTSKLAPQMSFTQSPRRRDWMGCSGPGEEAETPAAFLAVVESTKRLTASRLAEGGGRRRRGFTGGEEATGEESKSMVSVVPGGLKPFLSLSLQNWNSSNGYIRPKDINTLTVKPRCP